MQAVETTSPTMGTAAACDALGVARASVYRRRQPARPPAPRPTPPRALDPIERQTVLETLHSERFLDAAPAQVHATLLDEGTYLCSPRTMYRLLDTAGEIKERRAQVRRPHYAAPELLATQSNEVWSWDITKLLGPAKWTYFYLYVILDIFSRYVVGWMLAPRETAALAERLIAETCAKHAIHPGQLTIHADRGGAMRSKPVALLLADLGVTKTHSRPHVSNDNPFSEAQFRTLKYCPQFPERFGSLEDGRAFGQAFFRWYNHEHRHSGLGFLTPAVVHFGHAAPVRAHRQQVLAAAYAAHPERFVKGRPQPADLPTAVWINPPVKTPTRQDAPATTIVTADDLQVDPISGADDHSAVSVIDRRATLITSPVVSQCH
ncbi:MAG: integrase [Acidobacteria bacterium RIFCSPLOWO2_02_FULL_68_18]|nr:MAG: integrase [Acidobacteria bacterium RIFCSPLOWO2_02_FULL_68_18]OFW50332.1 MAG: integrase [Acidobacteria bacterium RIFCSPLOWO2_12_FULL_68_19]